MLSKPDSRRISVARTHECAEREDAFRLRDRLEAAKRLDDAGEEATLWGAAITRVDQTYDGVWLAHNDEYSTPVSYCPFCGVRLESLRE